MAWRCALSGVLLLLLGLALAAGHRDEPSVRAAAALGAKSATPTPDPTGCFSEVRNAGGHVLRAIAALAPSDMWAVGDTVQGGPLVQHWDGAAWTIVPLPAVPARGYLRGVAARAPDDIWAVGGYYDGNMDVPLILHGSTTGWEVVPSAAGITGGRLTSVAIVAGGDVWAVGETVSVLGPNGSLSEHWNGQVWTLVSTPSPGYSTTLQGVTAVPGTDEVWATGYTTSSSGWGSEHALTLHWSGGQWAIVPAVEPVPEGNMLFSVWAASATSIWAVGRFYSPTLQHFATLVERWDGTAWQVVPSPSPGGSLVGFLAVSGTGPDDIWAAGVTTDASRLLSLVEHWNGEAWEVVPSPSPGVRDVWLYGIAVPVRGEAWAVGNTGDNSSLTIHNTSSCPTPTPTFTPSPTPCRPHWDYVDSPNIPNTIDILRAVSGVSPSDVWAVGESHLESQQTIALHWDGASWTLVPSPSPGSGTNALRGVAALAPDNVWAVGYYQADTDHTLIIHWDGSQWQVVPDDAPAAAHLNGIAAVGAADIWAVGDGPDGALWEHWDGSTWSVVPGPTTSGLTAVTAVAAGDVWSVGGAGDTQHWNGQEWAEVPGAVSGAFLSGVAAVASHDVWAVGWLGQATLAEHWNGTAWTVVQTVNPAPNGNRLYGVAAAGPAAVWAVGSTPNYAGRATLMVERWDGSAWTLDNIQPAAPRFNELYGVTALTQRRAWAVGYYEYLGRDVSLTEQYTNDCALPPVTPSPTVSAGPSGTVTPGRTGTAIPSHTPIAGSPTATPCGITFRDVQESDFFYRPVEYLACHGVISGYADETFRPYNNTTRAQMVKMIVLATARPFVTPSAGGHTFADVAPGFPFFSVVETAAATHIVSGYTCGAPGEPCDTARRPYFRPYAAVTRGQLSKIDALGAEWALGEPVSPTFTDVGSDSTFYTYIEAAACHGVVSGYACGGRGEPCDPQNRPYFRPYNDATRGQIAKIVYLSIGSDPVCGPP